MSSLPVFVWRKTKHKLPKERVWDITPAFGQHEKVTFKQAASVNRLVGTFIGAGTQNFLIRRGYCLRVLRPDRYANTVKLIGVCHITGVAGYEQPESVWQQRYINKYTKAWVVR